VGLYDLDKKEYEGDKKRGPRLSELYREIQNEEDEALTDGSKDPPGPEAIRSVIAGSQGSIIHKLEEMGICFDDFDYPNKEFDKMKLLKCLYYQQKKYKLLTILGKPSLQIVDNSSMIGTGFHSYNEYGDIIKNFKEEIGKCISPDTSLFFEQFLLLAIRCAEYPCSYLESNDFVERPEFQNTMNYVLPVVKYSLDRTLEDLRNDHEHKKIENTIFEVMYLKTIVFENIGREKDFILMTSIFSEIDKLLGPTTKDIESDIIAYKALKVYIEKNIGKIARYFKQNNCNNKKLESDILKVIPKLELLLEWREKHAMGKRPGKKPANALFFVQLIAFLEILLILKNHKELKLIHNHYGWKPDTGSLYSKIREGASEFYEIFLSRLAMRNESRWKYGEGNAAAYGDLEDWMDETIMKLKDARDMDELHIYMLLFNGCWEMIEEKFKK